MDPNTTFISDRSHMTSIKLLVFLDPPCHCLTHGNTIPFRQAIVLSGLREKASQSLQDISRLYEETKYLKGYLEKVSAMYRLAHLLRERNMLTPNLRLH